MIFGLLTLVGLASAQAEHSASLENDYLSHMANYGRSISSLAEYKYRLDAFATTDDLVKKINSEGRSFTLAHNQFSDWTAEEHTNSRPKVNYGEMMAEIHEEETRARKLYKSVKENYSEGPQQQSIDLRDEGAISPVKDQGRCHASWAFATAGALESAWFKEIQYATHRKLPKNLLVFSTQQLISCDTMFNMGCTEGGHPVYAFRYYERQYAIPDSDYPLESNKDGQK